MFRQQFYCWLAARFATLAPALHARRSAGEQIELPPYLGLLLINPRRAVFCKSLSFSLS
jgi:hypothetical protein